MQEFDDQVVQAREAANTATRTAQSELGLKNAEIRILTGEPGAAICKLAAELSAEAIVVGNRGRGRLKRALLGSVSDHVVRNAPCTVVVTKS